MDLAEQEHYTSYDSEGEEREGETFMVGSKNYVGLIFELI